MAASIFQGTSVKILKNILKFADGTTLSSTVAGYLSTLSSNVQTQLNSKVGLTTTSKTGAYTAAAFEYVLADTTSSAFTITLPAPAANAIVWVKDKAGTAETNNITVSRNSSENIDGATTYVISSNYGSAMFVSDGTNWFIS